MKEDDKLDLDGNRPATLHNGAVSTDFPTLQDAIMARHRLGPEQAQRASIKSLEGNFTQPLKYRSCPMVQKADENLSDPRDPGAMPLPPNF